MKTGKNRFCGTYWKFVAPDGFSLAFIDSVSADGRALQLATPHGYYRILDPTQVEMSEGRLCFRVSQADLKLFGELKLGKLRPIRDQAMSLLAVPCRWIQCAHRIVSLYHEVSGSLRLNFVDHEFDNGWGYAEENSGKSFPEKYIWFHSIGRGYGVSLAIASIPLGKLRLTGLSCIVGLSGREVHLSTYNHARILRMDEKQLRIRKGRYELTILLREAMPHLLAAPEGGHMSRQVEDVLAIPSTVIFTDGDRVLLSVEDYNASLEMVGMRDDL